jgi:hypothetical protein
MSWKRVNASEALDLSTDDGDGKPDDSWDDEVMEN